MLQHGNDVGHYPSLPIGQRIVTYLTQFSIGEKFRQTTMTAEAWQHSNFSKTYRR
jgi:hypothetical protein